MRDSDADQKAGHLQLEVEHACANSRVHVSEVV